MYVLVIARNANSRQLYVKNLIARGHLAVGVPSLSYANELLERRTPRLLVLCQVPRVYEPEIAEIRRDDRLKSVQFVLVSHDVFEAAPFEDQYQLVSLSHPANIHHLIGFLKSNSTDSHGELAS